MTDTGSARAATGSSAANARIRGTLRIHTPFCTLRRVASNAPGVPARRRDTEPLFIAAGDARRPRDRATGRPTAAAWWFRSVRDACVVTTLTPAVTPAPYASAVAAAMSRIVRMRITFISLSAATIGDGCSYQVPELRPHGPLCKRASSARHDRIGRPALCRHFAVAGRRLVVEFRVLYSSRSAVER